MKTEHKEGETGESAHDQGARPKEGLDGIQTEATRGKEAETTKETEEA